MRSAFACAVLCLLLCLSVGAHAATMTYNFTFTALGPNPASGSFTVTFDPTQIYAGTTAGLTVNSLNAGTQGASGFSYNPAVLNGFLTIGGVINGVSGIGSRTDDYIVNFIGFTTAKRRFA